MNGPAASRASVDLIQKLPAAIYTCGTDGFIETFNASAVELWGEAPVPGKTRWCGSLRIFRPDGSPLPADQCPMAVTLREGKAVRGEEIVVERPDGSRRHVIPYPELLHDEDGNVVGAVNMLVDITQRRLEEKDRELASRLPFENPSPVLRLNEGSIVGFANPAADVILEAWKISPGEEAPAEITALTTAAIESGEKSTVEVNLHGRIYMVRIAPVTSTNSVNLYFNDVTELKQAEAALRVTEQRFHALATNAPVAIFTKDREGRYTIANPITCATLGQVESVVGRTDHELVSKELADILREHDLQVINEGKPVVWVERVGDRQFLSSKFPLLDADSAAVGVCGVSVDITARAASEKLLRESEEKFRTLANHAPVGIFLSAPNGDSLFVNGSWCAMAGLEARHALGTGWTKAIHPDDRERVLGAWDEAVRAKASSDSEFRFLKPDGSVTWVQGSALRLVDSEGQPAGYIGSCVDITERKNTERQLERQAQRLRLLWEAAAVILTAEDPDMMLQRVFGKISKLLEVDTFFNFMVNDAGDGLELRSCHGVPEGELPGLARLEFGQAICGNVAARREPIVACSIQDSDHPAVQLVKGMGIQAYACNPLLAGDELLGTLSFASRTRVAFEPDEIEFMETISHYVTVAYLRWRLVENLRAADRRKDEFLATLAHELRNPLAPIRTGLEVMRMAGNNPSAIERIRSTMERQVEQLVILVNDLLDVSRITRGKLQLRKSRVELAEVVRSAVEASQPVISEGSHRLTLTMPGAPVFIDADPHRLAQVISNLLNNAAKYTDGPGEISLAVEQEDSEVTVKIRDNGIGIPAGMLDRIFDMFTQIDSPGGADYGGLGIGLTLVKSLVEMHGGSVRAESDGSRQGSTFSFQLPVMIDGSPNPTGHAEAANGKSARHRVLVVDDNEAAAETLAMVVELLGHDVKVGKNGKEGLELAEIFLPQVIFMDLGMPVMDGWETARRLRQQVWGKDVLLVAVTGWGQDEDRRKTKEAGFDHHLVKPATPASIRELLERPASLS
ncbi:PAS domain S-box protein [Luteolibacter luteus]|uniref:histidine kinase n=1 Tax=Luteolibacter luteus TaxID=2728835 RepID=A0A858RKS8_9BACT|nr:PAS domain S-box protein [Luteolibacter luteus]QJE97345.1 PAS domain S-box protein [Luteolibacter luteus]